MDMDRTTYFSAGTTAAPSQRVTIFDGGRPPYTLELSSFNKTTVTFGRDAGNDIVLGSPLVSRQRHGAFVCIKGSWVIRDNNSTNGIVCNERQIKERSLSDGDFFRIDDGVETIADGVLFVTTSSKTQSRWSTVPTRSGLTIGRDRDCGITLPHISVSKLHATISGENGRFYITDNGSTNGVIVNGRRISSRTRLHEKDVIAITNSRLIFTSLCVSYCCYESGVTVDASDIVIERKHGRERNVTCDHVSLDIRPRELVAIIGGSGAGKSTVLNALSGYLTPAGGTVYINGVDLYNNFDSLKKLIGYVPQSDIVYDNLSLYDMLAYTAKLRLPADAAEKDREQAIARAVSTVELADKRDSLIKNLSGGQRKRASIAVELLSDPNLLFLDEPASGLDPGTERNLMHSLRAMADRGKTVILVTHSTLQLKLCDKIVFMGRGGRLCFCGSYDEALAFFGVSDVVDIYNMITDQSKEWSKRYEAKTGEGGKNRVAEAYSTKPKKDGLARQLGVLCSRYLKLILNDRQRLLLLLVQAPVLAALISFVADDTQFVQYEMTKSLLFALSCSAFWVGMLNAIQEVCKERTILKREYMTGLRLDSYILSKIVVLGLMCAVQSLLIITVFALLVGIPEAGVMLPPFAELLVTAFLTALASAATGLFVSSLFSNPDRAMTVAPILLMPQILFSGLIFRLEGAAEGLSWAAMCRWSMEGFGTTADLNSLQLRLQQEGVTLLHQAEDFFTFTSGHMLKAWGILALYTVVFLLLAGAALRSVKKDS